MTPHMDKKGRTEAYLRALSAFQDLMATQGEDAVSRAYAEAVAETYRDSFAKSRGLKQSDGRLCVHRLLGKQCNFKDCVGCPTTISLLFLYLYVNI